MSAFCVYGISLENCKKIAEKKVSTYDSETKTPLEMTAWAEKRDQFAHDLFLSADRIRQISPEFDTPQFCSDWILVAGDRQVRLAKIMVRGPKSDKNGVPIKRDGKQVMTWLEYGRQTQVVAA